MCPEIELELARVVELRFSLAEAVPTPKLAILDATFSDPTRSDGSAASEAVSMRLRVWRHVSRSAGEVNLSSRHCGATWVEEEDLVRCPKEERR